MAKKKELGPQPEEEDPIEGETWEEYCSRMDVLDQMEAENDTATPWSIRERHDPHMGSQ